MKVICLFLIAAVCLLCAIVGAAGNFAFPAYVVGMLFLAAAVIALAILPERQPQARPTPIDGQTRMLSLTESLTNIAAGYVINLVANLLILPLYGFHVTLRAAVDIGIAFTGISVARSYCIRRWFNTIGR